MLAKLNSNNKMLSELINFSIKNGNTAIKNNDYAMLSNFFVDESYETGAFNLVREDGQVLGNLLITGYTNSFDDDAFGGYGGTDFWLLELDSNLDTLRTHKFGGTGEDYASAAVEASDQNSFYVVGYTNSTDYFVNEMKGEADIWIGKIAQDKTLDIQETPQKSNLYIYPNPTTGNVFINGASGKTVSINNILGMEVYKAEIINNNFKIQLSSLQNGVYTVNVGGGEVEKIVIRK